MAKAELFSETELAFLRELKRRRVPFMLVDLSAATLQGAPVVTQDVDLWFADVGSPALKAALGAVGGFYVPPTAHTPPMIGGESVKLFDLVAAMHGLRSFVAEYRQAVSINLGGLTVKVLPLQRIIASKRAANRPKDKLVLPVLEDTAATIKAGQRRTKARTVSGKKKRK